MLWHHGTVGKCRADLYGNKSQWHNHLQDFRIVGCYWYQQPLESKGRKSATDYARIPVYLVTPVGDDVDASVVGHAEARTFVRDPTGERRRGPGVPGIPKDAREYTWRAPSSSAAAAAPAEEEGVKAWGTRGTSKVDEHLHLGTLRIIGFNTNDEDELVYFVAAESDDKCEKVFPVAAEDFTQLE